MRELSRRDILYAGSAFMTAIATGGIYKAATAPRIDFQSLNRPDATPIPTPEKNIQIRGTLVIEQIERVGNPYLDILEANYKKFEPFNPYGYIIVSDRDKVENGAITISKETLEGNNRSIDIPLALAKSIPRRILDSGSPYKPLSNYSDFVEYCEGRVFANTDYGFETDHVEEALQILNPYQGQDIEYLKDPLNLFGAITTSLHLNGEGIKDYLLDMPLDTKPVYDDNMMIQSNTLVDSQTVVIAKDLIHKVFSFYTDLVDKTDATNNDLTNLIPKDGIIRYELFRI